ncbi:MAG: sigma-70 family RNA polymerase sigma factor [Oscillospiraceae bacterium]|nr:sigma-70 family RNA polymerase sigma factor [Oscillospiraceae bacterium]
MAKSLLRTDSEIAEIYKRNADTVYWVCFNYMKNRADTEDAVSDTFVKMIAATPIFESEEHEKAWLIRTAANICKNYLKHWRRRLENLDDYTDSLIVESGFEIDETLDIVCRLPEKYKTAVYLHYYEGYTSVQISKMLQKPQSTIRYYLHEARKALKKELGGNFDEK